MRKQVVIIRRGALGDVIWTEPIISYFLDRDFKVKLISRYASIFKNRTNLLKIEKLSYFEKLRIKVFSFLFRDYFKVINLDNTYEQQPQHSIIKAYVDKVGLPINCNVNKLNFELDETNRLKKTKKVAIFHIQAASQILNHRNAFGVNWNELEKMLEVNGFQTIEIISQFDNYNPILQNHLIVNLEELFGTIEQCDLFIGLDSGPAHIANLLKIKSFLFFGSVKPELRLDMDNFQGHIFQSPCEFAGCYHSAIGTRGAICKIVGEFGEPPCCVHKSNEVLEIIKKNI
jgi:hypothetical protein